MLAQNSKTAYLCHLNRQACRLHFTPIDSMKKAFLLLFTICLLGGQWATAQFTQAPLPYGFAALEPHIDAQTMEIHFTKHHAAYIKNLNAAVAGTDIAFAKLEDIFAKVSKYSDVVRNNAGGHYNHAMFWTILTDKKTKLDPQLEEAIKGTWTSVDSMKSLINKAAATRFGSGWAWLYVTPEGKLAIGSSPNQDNPLMDNSPIKGYPILGIDVWEHAYYLKYQNKRGDYLAAIWNVINWEEVSNRYFTVVKKKSKFDVWPTLKDYHQVISETFHPAEEGNFAPIKARAGELMQKADVLASTSIPKDFNAPDVIKNIKKLKAETKKLNDLIAKKATDAVILKAFTGVHQTFHAIVTYCFGEK
jgi:superoxide dismutase